jgi:hypothetical protein
LSHLVELLYICNPVKKMRKREGGWKKKGSKNVTDIYRSIPKSGEPSIRDNIKIETEIFVHRNINRLFIFEKFAETLF